MAQKIVTTYVDDITGEDLSAGEHQQVTLALNGKTWNLDLGTESLSLVTDTIQEWTKNADDVAKPASVTRAAKVPAADRRAQLQAIREWARARGIVVSNRGRIPIEVEAAFNAAHAN